MSRTQHFIVILYRNLAFFQTLCGAVPEYIGRRIEAVITGLTRNQLNSKEFRGFESHRLRQVSLPNSTLGSDFFIAALQNFDAFLIGISPLFSSSDFSGSVQIIPAIVGNSYSQNYPRFFRHLGYKLTAKKTAPDFSDAAAVQITTSLWAALRAMSACLPSSGRSGSWTVNPDARRYSL